VSKVLFVCLHNAGRSQMSEALFERAAGGVHEARSAGTSPGDKVHDSVVTVMREKGIDLSTHKPQLLTTDLAQWADVVITMGCGDACPVIPGKRYVDWDLPDPNGLPVEQVREIRDDLASRVIVLMESLDRNSS
jgi:arsenate reductase (thioredoxin)